MLTMKKYHLFLSLSLIAYFTAPMLAQKSFLQSGPMLGYSDMFESLFWVQTNAPAKVQFAYWVKGKPLQKFFTASQTTQKNEGFTAHLIADQVLPGNVYEYELRINDQPVALDYPTTFQTQALWQWRMEPPAFKVALGSCSYVNEPAYDRPGTPYGAEYQIFTYMHQQRPDLMLWLGDNVYLREPDWNTRTGFLHRYTHTRSLPELQPLLASSHQYAMWDDHDYGPNDSDGSFIHKDLATEMFRLFWGNPSYGLPGQGGITGQFRWADVDFFLLDNRYFRTSNNLKTGEHTIIGQTQFDWLINALAYSDATFKMIVIGGQVLTTYDDLETYIHTSPEERIRLLKRIEEEGIKNVIFLTGDRHHTELSKMTYENGHDIYDLTVSPLTSGVHQTNETNLLRVEGTLVAERNFGILEFSGPRKGRNLIIRIINANGKELWSRTITAE
jgi:alkaline phosphatase D